MDSLSTLHNLQQIVHNLGTLSEEQLLSFFRMSKDAEKVQHYIDQYVSMKFFERENQWIRWKGAPQESEQAVRRRIMAFWLVAYLGQENIREIYPLAYPFELLFYTNSNDCYDVTVCLNDIDAKNFAHMAALFANKRPVSDDDDPINHVAVVRNKAIGKRVLLSASGMIDSCCVLNPETKIPQYYTLDDLEDVLLEDEE